MKEINQEPLRSIFIREENSDVPSLKSGLIVIEQIGGKDGIHEIVIAKDKVKELIHKLEKEIS